MALYNPGFIIQQFSIPVIKYEIIIVLKLSKHPCHFSLQSYKYYSISIMHGRFLENNQC